MNFVVIDVETANPNLSSICQVGIAPFLVQQRERSAATVLEDSREVSFRGTLSFRKFSSYSFGSKVQ
jgi:hypothetical protein